MKLYLFNPDTELAMAHNRPHYIAPTAVRQMCADLAWLPMWYASQGSAVCVPHAADGGYVERMESLFGLEVRTLTEAACARWTDGWQLAPWGWDRVLWHRCRAWGVPLVGLPTPEGLERHRQCVSRRMAVAWLPLVRQGVDESCGEAVVLESADDCRAYAMSHPQCLFKQPWSSSGKGLRWCRGRLGEDDLRWCAHAIHAQGCVVASPIYNKVCDLAMEFRRSPQGKVSFVGYSLFRTNGRGGYLENILTGSEESFLRHIGRYLAPELLAAVRDRWLQLLGGLDDDCAEYIGVDMMVCQEAGRYLLHPCVEVNLRMTMGVLSCLLADRLLAPGSEGVFRIHSASSPEALQEAHATWLRGSPLRVEAGRVVSGYLPLVPVTPHSYMTASVFVSPEENIFST